MKSPTVLGESSRSARRSTRSAATRRSCGHDLSSPVRPPGRAPAVNESNFGSSLSAAEWFMVAPVDRGRAAGPGRVRRRRISAPVMSELCPRCDQTGPDRRCRRPACVVSHLGAYFRATARLNVRTPTPPLAGGRIRDRFSLAHGRLCLVRAAGPMTGRFLPVFGARPQCKFRCARSRGQLPLADRNLHIITGAC